jgi:antitoxin (DNA-binding transcriptional repressor) of toxin-antitoxin stability system
MKRITALELRQSLGRVARLLEKGGEPIILEKNHRAVAVLVSIRDFEQRFVEKSAAEARLKLLQEMDALARPAHDGSSAESILREARDRA